MAVLVLDAGVLIAHERRDPHAAAWLSRAAVEGVDLAVAAPVLAEVWRDGARQPRLARLLRACRPVTCDADLAREAGALLAATGSAATIDALVVATAARLRAVVVTDDLDIVAPLARAAGVRTAALRS